VLASEDGDTEKQVERVVNDQMLSSLARIEHLSPRGNQKDYDSINTILEELDK
jgi:hypothetical protein